MHSGTRPSRHAHLEKPFPHFAGTLEIPDFCLDQGVNGMPDQDKDNAPYECVGYTTADLLSDIFKTPIDPDFSYAAARYVAGDGPEGTQGTSFHAGLQGAIAVGALSKAFAPISAAHNSEKFVSDWNNWLPSLRQAALSYAQNGLRNVLGQGDAFDSIVSALYTGKLSVSVGSPWFSEWTHDIQAGVVQTPSLGGNYPSWHNYAIKGKKTIQGIPHLIVKSWQGTRVGEAGWLYFSRETINAAMSVKGSGALTIVQDANRWASLWGIVAQRFPMIVPLLPQLFKLA